MTNNTGRLRIGEVHALLRAEFPGIELSKIRYYEEKGLVCPNRSRKGYRLYSDRDVACLREAFRLAQQEFVPLRVIRQRLIEQGLLDDAPVTSIAARRAAHEVASNIVAMRVPERDERDEEAVPTPSAPAEVTVVNFGSTAARFSELDFLAASQLRSDQLAELRRFGLLAPRELAGQSIYDEGDLIVARRARALIERGVEVRHLQPLKRIVERQVDLLHDLTAPLRLSGERRGADPIAETRAINDELAALRTALMTRALQEYFGH